MVDNLIVFVLFRIVLNCPTGLLERAPSASELHAQALVCGDKLLCRIFSHSTVWPRRKR